MVLRIDLKVFDTVKWMGDSYMISHMYAHRCRARQLDGGKSVWLRYEWIEIAK